MRPSSCFILLPVLCLSLAAARAGTPLPDAPHIVVSGSGEVSVKPDAVTVTFEFRRLADAPLPAKQRVDAAVNRLLEGLPGFEVDEEDVVASSLDTGEEVDYDDDGNSVRKGYYARREVTATLRDLERFNAFLDSGLEAGATSISSVAFESSRADALRQEAKSKAVEDARREAGEMARSFGTTLGPVYSIDSVGSRVMDGYGGTSLDRIEVSGSRLDPGRYVQPTVEYSASVRAVFELQR